MSAGEHRVPLSLAFEADGLAAGETVAGGEIMRRAGRYSAGRTPSFGLPTRHGPAMN